MAGKHGGRREGAGRKKGAVSKAKREIAEEAKQFASAALATLVDVAQNSDSDSSRVSAAVAILDRGYGKPHQAHVGDDDEPAIKHDHKVEWVIVDPAPRS
mgnify:CR=1 FL=1